MNCLWILKTFSWSAKNICTLSSLNGQFELIVFKQIGVYELTCKLSLQVALLHLTVYWLASFGHELHNDRINYGLLKQMLDLHC